MDQEQLLLTEYTEVCKSYHAISDFRGKLLALIPIVSGTAISLLVGKNSIHLLAVGAFGILVTLGLFFYELRGIQRCKYLISIGAKLESELKIEWGQFKDRPGRLYGFIGAEIAGWIIYLAVLFGWLYVTAVGISSLSK